MANKCANNMNMFLLHSQQMCEQYEHVSTTFTTNVRTI